MPKFQEFKIEYKTEGQLQLYFPGRKVIGVVTLRLNEKIKVKSICLQAKGKAHIAWTQAKDSIHKEVNGSSHFHNYARYYSDNEKYLDKEIVLWGDKNGDAKILDEGVHQLPFSFDLPSTCPSSFEHSSGYVRYLCKAIVDIPWKFNCTTQNVFTVIDLIDLNKQPDLDLAISTPKVKSVYGWLGLKKSGDVQYEINLPRKGYVPGEILPFVANVANNSSATVSKTSITLLETVTLIADNQHTNRFERIVIKMEKAEEIQPGRNFTWKEDNMKLPAIAPTLINCRVLKIEYSLKLKISCKGLHLSESVSAPIFIGNIPLRSVFNELKKGSNKGQENSDRPLLTQLENIYPELPLPSYEEAVFGKVAIKEDTDSDEPNEANDKDEYEYVPRYICY